MKKRRNLVVLALLFTLGVYFGYNYIYQNHRDIKTEEAYKSVSATELVEIFKANASPDELNKTIEVSGSVSEMDAQSITLNKAVLCSFDGELPKVAIGDQLKIKGRCIGYDDLFEIVKLDQSSLIK